MAKCIRYGKVAVLYSPGYGSGWVSWNTDRGAPAEFLLHDEKIVELVEKNQRDKIEDYIKSQYPDVYCGGVESLQIKWLPQGTQFRIEEYDGLEIIRINHDDYWFVA